VTTVLKVPKVPRLILRVFVFKLAFLVPQLNALISNLGEDERRLFEGALV